MKQLRRLTVEVPKDPYRRGQRGLLRSFELSEAEFRELEREHADHIVVEGEAVLVAQPRGHQIDLHYAFPDRDAFARQFPAMFQRLVAAVRPDEGPLGFRLKLTDAPSRPYVEPVLSAQAFELIRDWVRMALAELPADVECSDDLAPGFVLRPAGPDDAEAIAQLEAVAFAVSWLTPAVARRMLAQAQVLRLLEETSTGRAAGFLHVRLDPPTGYVSDVAVHPDYQRRGLGEALLRWALGWFRQQGLRSAALTVNTDNAPAIALYRKLGFAPAETGLDYRRPIDEEEVRQVLEKHRAAHIRVRRRY